MKSDGVIGKCVWDVMRTSGWESACVPSENVSAKIVSEEARSRKKGSGSGNEVGCERVAGIAMGHGQENRSNQ